MIEALSLERVQAPPQPNSRAPLSGPQSHPGKLPAPGQWTYEDWRRLPDDGFQYEVLNGELYMVPPPTVEHQRISFRLALKMGTFVLAHQLGEVLEAPCGVQLPGQPVPVQPDIFFIRAERLHILGREYVEGAPDLVIEVLSPSNWLYDRREKFLAYQEAGVAEYWIVDPRLGTIEVFVLEKGMFTLVSKSSGEDVARSQVLEGFEVIAKEILVE
jgi:Uma2 family endonuclease